MKEVEMKMSAVRLSHLRLFTRKLSD